MAWILYAIEYDGRIAKFSIVELVANVHVWPRYFFLLRCFRWRHFRYSSCVACVLIVNCFNSRSAISTISLPL